MTLAAAPAGPSDAAATRFAGDGVRQSACYALVSALALGIDTGALLALAKAGMPAAAAGGTAYALGLVAHYLLSHSLVFDAAATAKSNVRLFFEFCLSGLAGLLLTMAIVAVLGGVLGLGLLVAKSAAVAASFVAVYLVRKFVVFAADR